MLAMSSRSSQQEGGGSGSREIGAAELLSVSATAAAYVKDYLGRAGKAGSAIRISAVRAHCMGGRGFDYGIAEDSEKPGDTVVACEGLRLLVDSSSMRHLRGAEIQFEQTFQGGGLVVRNPNAVGRCHCGRHDVFDGQES